MQPVTPQATRQESCTRPTDAKSDEEKRVESEDRYKNAGEDTLTHVRVRNRRKRYLDLHPEYFGPSLELADPLLYDRLIRRFQTVAQRELEGRSQGWSGVLEADLHRSEAKMEALQNPEASGSLFTYRRGPGGEILAEEAEDIPRNREEGRERWVKEMTIRFLKGDDDDFGDTGYQDVDRNEELDDWVESERDNEEDYFRAEKATWVGEVKGETGIQDF